MEINQNKPTRVAGFAIGFPLTSPLVFYVGIKFMYRGKRPIMISGSSPPLN
jgi:hypothetical protein